MKKLILQRLYNIYTLNNKFTKNLMRWRTFEIYSTPIQNIPFDNFTEMEDQFTDEQILNMFEMIVRKCSKQY